MQPQRTAYIQQQLPFQSLLTRYLSGQITDQPWQHFMHAFDAANVPSTERMALASFFSDAAQELGAEAIKVPQPSELESVLAATRTA